MHMYKTPEVFAWSKYILDFHESSYNSKFLFSYLHTEKLKCLKIILMINMLVLIFLSSKARAIRSLNDVSLIETKCASVREAPNGLD